MIPLIRLAGIVKSNITRSLRQARDFYADQPVILDIDVNDAPDEAGAGDQAEGASGRVDTRCIELDTSLHNTLPTSVLPPALTESIDTSGLWYDIEEGCYIEESASGLESNEQHNVPSIPSQAQPQTLPQYPAPLQDQTEQQGIADIIQSTFVESALHFLPKLPNRGDNGWTPENVAELEKELETALRERGDSPSAGAALSPRSVEAPQDDQSREHCEITGGRPEEPRDVSRCVTPAQGLDLEQWEALVAVESLGGREPGEETLVGEVGGVEIRQPWELAGRPAEGHQQNQADVGDTTDPMAEETLPATKLEIDHRHFRLRGIRSRQLTKPQRKKPSTESFGVSI
jgi:hypothetical protein